MDSYALKQGRKGNMAQMSIENVRELEAIEPALVELDKAFAVLQKAEQPRAWQLRFLIQDLRVRQNELEQRLKS